MAMESSPLPSLEELRATASSYGVAATDEDLIAVTGFLATILPALREIEESTPADTTPAGTFRPEDEPT